MMLPGQIIDPEALLGGRWRPTTESILFANAPAARVVDEFLHGVRGRHVMNEFHSPLKATEVPHGTLDDRFNTLLPFDRVESRRLLVLATANPQWSAIFGSGWRGLDGISPLSWLTVGGIQGVLIEDAPHRPRAAPPNGSYGIRRMQTYELVPGADKTAHPHAIVARAESARKWEVRANPDDPFPVGIVWDPDAKRIQDRFTHAHLVEMARRYGLRPFDEDFYPVNGDAFLVSRTDEDPLDSTRLTMEQARGLEPPPKGMLPE